MRVAVGTCHQNTLVSGLPPTETTILLRSSEANTSGESGPSNWRKKSVICGGGAGAFAALIFSLFNASVNAHAARTTCLPPDREACISMPLRLLPSPQFPVAVIAAIQPAELGTVADKYSMMSWVSRMASGEAPFAGQYAINAFCPANGFRAAIKSIFPSSSNFHRGPCRRTASSIEASCEEALSSRVWIFEALRSTVFTDVTASPASRVTIASNCSLLALSSLVLERN